MSNLSRATNYRLAKRLKTDDLGDCLHSSDSDESVSDISPTILKEGEEWNQSLNESESVFPRQLNIEDQQIDGAIEQNSPEREVLQVQVRDDNNIEEAEVQVGPGEGEEEIDSDDDDEDDDDNVGPHVDEDCDQEISEDEDDISDTEERGPESGINFNSAPIFEGSRISLYESFLAVLSLAIRHGLTAVCIVDILILNSLHCKICNIYKKTLYHFKKTLSDFELPFQYHFFCDFCFCELPDQKSKCQNREVTHPETCGINYVLELPLAWQLQKLFQRQEIYENLGHRFSRQKVNVNNIEDIYDGEVYKRYSTKELLGNPNNTSLLWYTDGVPVFRSTLGSLWVIYFCINELPPQLRFKRENLLIGGLWFGRSKPKANVFLKSFVQTFKELLQGITITPFGGLPLFTMRTILLCGTCDLPAKSLFLGMIGHNGAFGCSFCFTKGKTHNIENKKKSHVWVYPYDKITASRLRNHKETEQHALNAIQRRKVNPKVSSYYGVKHPSLLFKIMPDVIGGMSIDVMHCIYEGIMNKLITLWFSSTYSKEAFSIRKHLETIDEKLKKIRPPYYIARIPRSIKDDISFWKANEFKSFCLYYGLPLLIGILPAECLDNFADLVYVVYTLSQQSISMEELTKCEEAIHRFVKNYERLYGERHMTMNIHLALHLPLVVRKLGPLWAYCCFRFEDMNGAILKLIHGTRFTVQVLAQNILLLRNLKLKIELLPDGELKDFCATLTTGGKRLKITEMIEPHTYSVGKYTFMSDISIDTIMKQALIAARDKDDIAKCLTFNRLKRNNFIFTTEAYSCNYKNDNSLVLFENEDGTQVGIIKSFIRISNCYCRTSECRCQPSNFYTIIQVCETAPFNRSSVSLQNIVHIQKYYRTEYYVAVDVKNVTEILIDVNGTHFCRLCNIIENE